MRLGFGSRLTGIPITTIPQRPVTAFDLIEHLELLTPVWPWLPTTQGLATLTAIRAFPPFPEMQRHIEALIRNQALYSTAEKS